MAGLLSFDFPSFRNVVFGGALADVLMVLLNPRLHACGEFLYHNAPGLLFVFFLAVEFVSFGCCSHRPTPVGRVVPCGGSNSMSMPSLLYSYSQTFILNSSGRMETKSAFSSLWMGMMSAGLISSQSRTKSCLETWPDVWIRSFIVQLFSRNCST